MPENKSKWGVAKGDEIQHFFIPQSDYFIPCCDKGGTVEYEVTGGAGKPKCEACEYNEKGC